MDVDVAQIVKKALICKERNEDKMKNSVKQNKNGEVGTWHNCFRNDRMCEIKIF